MSPRTSTTSNLNPFAPEYNPIPPGIAQYSSHAPPPFFRRLPLPTAHRLPLSYPSLSQHLLPHQNLPQPPSTTHNTHQQFYSTYYVTQNQISITSPPQRPPPTTTVAAQYGQQGGGLAPRGRGFGRGRGRGKEIKRVEKTSHFNTERRLLKFEENCVGFPKHQQFSKRGMHKEENRHKITPLNRDEERTTVMIKNIPYSCPREELMGMLDEFCLLENQKEGSTSRKEADQEQLVTYAYDFLYLPIDFRTKRSRGFAFVNFTNSRSAWKFHNTFHLKKWEYVERLKWSKKIEIVCAKIQGKENQVKHFSESTFECESDEYLPVVFRPARDGSGQAVEVTVVGNRRSARSWETRNNHRPKTW